MLRCDFKHSNVNLRQKKISREEKFIYIVFNKLYTGLIHKLMINKLMLKTQKFKYYRNCL